MKRYAILILPLMCIGCLLFGENSDVIPDANNVTDKESPTEVIILGALHSYHQNNPNYSLETVRDIILACKPQAILVELPPSFDGKPTVVNGRLTGDFGKSEERWASQQAAIKLDVPIYPFDMDRRREIRRETGYWGRLREVNKNYGAWVEAEKDQLPGLYAMELHSQHTLKCILCLAEKAGPEVVNSEVLDSIKRASDSLIPVFKKLMAEHPEKAHLAREFDFIRQHRQHRDECMVKKIKHYAQKHQGQRIIVVVGAEHRYRLRDLLKEDDAIYLKEYWECQSQ
jgi:pheromone shutdown protein TraB